MTLVGEIADHLLQKYGIMSQYMKGEQKLY